MMELQAKEKELRYRLMKNRVNSYAIERIVAQSDLNKVDLDYPEALDEAIKTEWKDFIIKGDRK